MLLAWGGYAFAWYGPTVSPGAEAGAPLSFLFPSVNEAYARASYETGGSIAGIRNGLAVVHAGGRPVLVDYRPGAKAPSPAPDLTLTDEGQETTIKCRGAEDSGFASQEIALRRPGLLTLMRRTSSEQWWWCFGKPKRTGNTLRWPDGTVLRIRRGTLASVVDDGYRDEKVVGLGLLRLKDPLPMAYPMVTARPDDGVLIVEIRRDRR